MSTINTIQERLKPAPRPPQPAFISSKAVSASITGEKVAHFEVRMQIEVQQGARDQTFDVLWRPAVGEVAEGETPLTISRSLQRQLVRKLFEAPVGTRFKGRMHREGDLKQFAIYHVWLEG